MSGRKQDWLWLYFDKIKVLGKAGCRATCKKCGKVMQGLVARMKQHFDSCKNAHTVDTSTTQTAPAVIHVPSLVLCVRKCLNVFCFVLYKQIVGNNPDNNWILRHKLLEGNPLCIFIIF